MGSTYRELLQIVVRAKLQEVLNPFFAQMNEFAKKTGDPIHSKGLLFDLVDQAWAGIRMELLERLEREKAKHSTGK